MKRRGTGTLFDLMQKGAAEKPASGKEAGKIIRLSSRPDRETGNTRKPEPEAEGFFENESFFKRNISLRMDTAMVIGFGLLVMFIAFFVIGRVTAPGSENITAKMPAHASSAVIPESAKPAKRIPAERLILAPGETEETSSPEPSSPAPAAEPAPSAQTPEQATPREPGRYTIQVACYTKTNKVIANEVVEFLSGKFEKVFIRESGKYLVICVGRFRDKDGSNAKETLEKLKETKYRTSKFSDARFYLLKK